MLRTIAWYTNFGTSLIGTLPKLYKVKSLTKQGREDEKQAYVHKVASKWAKSQLKMSGAKVTVYGEENIPKDIPVVFMSNHQGNFDIPLLMVHINRFKGFVAKTELKKVPLLRDWMEQINCVFMDRNDLRQSVKTIIEAIKIIQAGHSLVIFPEGTRSKGGPMGEFKAGSFKLATKPKVPIVPITINGSYKLLEKNGNKVKAAEVEIYIHPMIETANLTKEEIDELPNRVKTIIASKVDED
ncbi:MAG TPA: 1-acyl-sn-glycerol-3-phosphate acyltransferase [Epulopiscium sp.]|nr:1-acyl-sn-glycerol-3-phosphate acyltransferase [Candidatus Epulonipiscium sp.]